MGNISKYQLRQELALCAAAQRIDAANQVFTKADAAEKRVIIAKDVLAQLRAKRIIPRQCVYMRPANYASQGKEPDRLNGDQCHACALGACFAALGERLNGIDDFWATGRNAFGVNSTLGEFFTREQLALIECAFERDSVFARGKVTDNEVSDAVKYGQEFYTPKARMKAIMENIIANKGTFVP